MYIYCSYCVSWCWVVINEKKMTMIPCKYKKWTLLILHSQSIFFFFFFPCPLSFSGGALIRPMLPNMGCQGKKSVSSMSTILQTKVQLFCVCNSQWSTENTSVCQGDMIFEIFSNPKIYKSNNIYSINSIQMMIFEYFAINRSDPGVQSIWPGIPGF